MLRRQQRQDHPCHGSPRDQQVGRHFTPGRLQRPPGVAPRCAGDHADDQAAGGAHRQGMDAGGRAQTAPLRPRQQAQTHRQPGIRRMQHPQDRAGPGSPGLPMPEPCAMGQRCQAQPHRGHPVGPQQDPRGHATAGAARSWVNQAGPSDLRPRTEPPAARTWPRPVRRVENPAGTPATLAGPRQPLGRLATPSVTAGEIGASWPVPAARCCARSGNQEMQHQCI